MLAGQSGLDTVRDQAASNTFLRQSVHFRAESEQARKANQGGDAPGRSLLPKWDV